MAKINVEIEVADEDCCHCYFYDHDLGYCPIFNEYIDYSYMDWCYKRCESCLKREVKEYRSTQNEN